MPAARARPDSLHRCRRYRAESRHHRSGRRIFGPARSGKDPRQRTPADIVPLLVELVKPLGKFDHVTIGFPGMVKAGKVQSAPAYGTVGLGRIPWEP